MGSTYQEVVALQQEGRYEEALKVLQRGVTEEKDGKCAWYLGYLYEMGIWVLQDAEQALVLFEQSAALGYERAQARLWLRKHRNYRNYVPTSQMPTFEEIGASMMIAIEQYHPDPKLTETILLEAERQNDPFLFYFHYFCCYNPQNTDLKKVPSLTQAAKMGFAEAQQVTFLVCPNRKTEQFLRRAAEQGLQRAMWLLGSRMYHAKRHVGAKYWLLKFLKQSLLQAKKRSPYHDRVLEFVHKKQHIFLKIEHCHDTMMTLIAIRKFRQSVLTILPKDVVILIAKILWETRDHDAWRYNEQLIKDGKKILKLKL